MSGIIKAFLLLAVVVCTSKAQLHESRQLCLCHRVRGLTGLKSDIKDIQIYPATIFCDKVEIVVTISSGFRYCLNPKLNTVKRLLANIMSKKNARPVRATARPAESTSTPGSTNTARF